MGQRYYKFVDPFNPGISSYHYCGDRPRIVWPEKRPEDKRRFLEGIYASVVRARTAISKLAPVAPPAEVSGLVRTPSRNGRP
jgi:hypothetical protein